MRIVIHLLFVGAIVSCHGDGPLAVRGAPSRTIDASVGQRVEITLSTIGPGEYVSPPTITGSAVEFVEEMVVAPFTPGGPNQLFRFKAVSAGSAILRFQHTQASPTVTDTVVVR